VTTSLVISYPSIPFAAPYINVSAASNPYRPEYNLIAGERYLTFEKSAAATSWDITFGLGSTTKSADHLILARADILQSLGVTDLTLSRSSDDSAYTTELTTAAFASATLYGPDGNDYIAEFTATSAYQYWKLALSGASCKFNFSKLNVGTFFDFGVEPSAYEIDKPPAREAAFRSDSGALRMARTDQPRYFVRLAWSHVSDALATSFMQNIERYKHINPVFLYTRSVHAVLDNQRLLNCWLLNATSRYIEPGWNEVTADFVEVIG